MARYKVKWTECVGFYAYVEADSAEEARKLWEDDVSEHSPEPDGFCEIETDSVEVKKVAADSCSG